MNPQEFALKMEIAMSLTPEVEVAETEGWKITLEEATCLTCLADETSFDNADLLDDGDHRRDDQAISDYLR